jgi:hypothetical protein
LQPASTCIRRIAKTVWTPFGFTLPKRAKARPPGRRETAAWERTTAAKARRGEPTFRTEPSTHVFVRATGGSTTFSFSFSFSFFSFAPQPAKRARPTTGRTINRRTCPRLLRSTGGVDPVSFCRQQEWQPLV